MTIILIGIVICAIFGAISAAVASSRGHNAIAFFFLGALISPVLAIILVFVIQPPVKRTSRYGNSSRARLKRGAKVATARRTASRNPYEAPSER